MMMFCQFFFGIACRYSTDLVDDSAMKGKYVFSAAEYNLSSVETSKEE